MGFVTHVVHKYSQSKPLKKSSETEKIYRSDGGWNQRSELQPSKSTETTRYSATASARTVLSQRRAVHIEKVIVFSFFFVHLPASCLHHSRGGTALRKHFQASVVPPYCTILCLLCLLLCWQRIEMVVAKDGKES